MPYLDLLLPRLSGGQYKICLECSTREPFVAVEDCSGNPELVHLCYVNSGSTDVYVYNSGSHQLYWAVCHNLWDADIWNPGSGLMARVRQLGYPLNLPTDQREIPRSFFAR